VYYSIVCNSTVLTGRPKPAASIYTKYIKGGAVSRKAPMLAAPPFMAHG